MKVMEKIKNPWIGVVIAAVGCAQALVEVYQTKAEIEASGKAADDEYIANTKDNQRAVQDVLTFCAQANERLLERVVILEQGATKARGARSKSKNRKKKQRPPKSVKKLDSGYEVKFRSPQRAWEQKGKSRD